MEGSLGCRVSTRPKHCNSHTWGYTYSSSAQRRESGSHHQDIIPFRCVREDAQIVLELGLPLWTSGLGCFILAWQLCLGRLRTTVGRFLPLLVGARFHVGYEVSQTYAVDLCGRKKTNLLSMQTKGSVCYGLGLPNSIWKVEDGPDTSRLMAHHQEGN